MGDGRIGENEPDKMADSPLIPIQDANSPPLKKKQKCNRVKTGERVKTKKAGSIHSLPKLSSTTKRFSGLPSLSGTALSARKVQQSIIQIVSGRASVTSVMPG